MSMKEGHSTSRPPFYEGSNFAYWKSRMEHYLMTEIDMWFSITEGFMAPTENGKMLESSRWTVEQKMKAQANAKAIVTLQCGLSSEQLNKVGPFKSAKDLWDKLIELNEGTKDSRIAKRDLLINQLQNFTMKDGETVSSLHGRFKELLNGLHSVGESVENRDLIRYALKSFPRNSLWSSMVDAYKVSRDLSIVKLDELFCELELHEQANTSHKEKGIALVAGEKSKKKHKEKKKEKKESSSESEQDSDSDSDEELSSSEMANFVRRMMRHSRKFDKKDVKKIFNDEKRKGKSLVDSKNKTDVICYECKKKGHYKTECPKLKKQEEKIKKKKKALKATWDDSSSSSSEEDERKSSKHMALMALSHVEDSEDEDSHEEDVESSSESSSSDDEVISPKLDKMYATIACLTNALAKSKGKVKRLQNELKSLKNEIVPCESCMLHENDKNDVDDLEKENVSLKSQVDDLRCALVKFTSSSKYLDMILGAQRGVYNKAGLGFKSQDKEVKFMSLISRNHASRVKVVQAWVPKQFVIDATGPKVWVPKHLVHRV